jgi:hypothetical protein
VERRVLLKSIGRLPEIFVSLTLISSFQSLVRNKFTPLTDAESNLFHTITTGAPGLNHEGNEIYSIYGFKLLLKSNSNISGLIDQFLDTLKCPLTVVGYN